MSATVWHIRITHKFWNKQLPLMNSQLFPHFTARTDAKPEAPILWPPNAKSQLFGKTLMLGKIEGRRRKG